MSVFGRTALLAVAVGLALVSAPAGAAQSADAGRSVSFAKMAVRIPAGTAWAQLQADDLPFQCRNDDVLTWEAGDNDTFQDAELERIFRGELAKAGVRVSGDPTNLFEQDQKSSDLQVGALLTGIKATFCARHTLKGTFSSSKRLLVSGSAELDVEWQVYSTLEAKVVARIPTHGTYDTKQGLDGGSILIVHQAFAAAVDQLLASEAFRAAVAQSPSPATRPPPTSLRAPGAPAASRTPSEASSAVALVFAGEAMGSGFLISPDGYLLTNQHVVGDAQRVRVRWSDKTEAVGEVIRSDRRRDVALIKVDPKGRTPLAVRQGAPQLGETVFAIGTPLETEFQNTLTRGVVSGSRLVEGQAFVQSDVAVDHGNSGGPLIDDKGRVVAITDWGYAPDGVSHNLNFFIPIDDALRALGVELSS
jgi:S1-C subfamily serine protease